MREDYPPLLSFRRLKAEGGLTAEALESLASQASKGFLEHYGNTGQYLRGAITLLCEIATLEEEELARPGLKGLFPLLVERLSDAFDPQYCILYDAVFAQVINHCRQLPSGKDLDTQLRRFGLIDEAGFLQRKNRLKEVGISFPPSIRQGVKKIFILSRVTLGAEVAITSLILKKLKKVFPQAQLILLAAERVKQLYGGDPRVRIEPVRYERDGGLAQRLNSWLELIKIIDREREGLGLAELLVVDPDSRLTQLGLLPVIEDDRRYLFFESRGYRVPGLQSIGELTAHWLNERFGEDESDPLYPYVSLLPKDLSLARELVQRLRRTGHPYLISLSFGIGGNSYKRIPDPFEEKLLFSLLQEGSILILDKGIDEERERANRLIRKLKDSGKTVIEAREENLREVLEREDLNCHVLTWEGGIGLFSALIAESDEYIGYDSAGQHIAAALTIPTIDIFADLRYPIFAERWRPFGRSEVRVVRIENRLPDQALKEVLTVHRELRAKIQQRA